MSVEHNKEKLLYLVHRIPYPPNKGDKIRSFNILKYLSSRYQVYLGTFIDDPDDWKYVDDVRALCEDCYIAKLNPRIAKIRSLAGLLTGQPLTLPFYKDKGLENWVDQIVTTYEIDKTLVFSSAMAQFVDKVQFNMTRSVIDFVDIDSDKWRQYAQSKSWPVSAIYKREATTLLEYERQSAAVFNASLFVSEAEADMFRQLAPEVSAKVGHVNNGVDTHYFSPDGVYANPYIEGERVLVFTGAMDYWANVDAVTWFAKEVLPAVHECMPEVKFYIVGSRPTEQVQGLAKLPGVVVTGSVYDIRPYLAHANLVVAPMRIARGVQNKVLEAMAMGKCVLVTPQGHDGLTARIGVDLFVESDNVRFADSILDLMDNDKRHHVGRTAREQVVRQYGWESNLKFIGELLG